MPAVSWSPTPEFAFPRSYIVGITYVSDADFATMVDNLILSGFVALPLFLATKVLFPNWLPYNSNRYTLDFLVEASFYTTDGGETFIDSDCAVDYYISPSPLERRIRITDLPGGANTHNFDLELPPSDYWPISGQEP